MSVDWAKYKAELNAVILQGYERKVRNKAPLMQETATTTRYEGDKVELVHLDGQTETIEMQHTTVKHKIDQLDLEKGNFRTVADAIESMTTEMANSIESRLIDMVNSLPPELGGLFEASTPEEFAEQLLSKFEAMIVDFDDDGIPSNVMVIQPDSIKILMAMQELPWFVDRWEEMLGRKRREWCARERRRELVD